jgi:hypothetical protein
LKVEPRFELTENEREIVVVVKDVDRVIAVQRLNLALFIDREDNGVVGRI